nr:MAG TPA: hypothetical protein [Caudoviricetes sp.]
MYFKYRNTIYTRFSFDILSRSSYLFYSFKYPFPYISNTYILFRLITIC